MDYVTSLVEDNWCVIFVDGRAGVRKDFVFKDGKDYYYYLMVTVQLMDL